MGRQNHLCSGKHGGVYPAGAGVAAAGPPLASCARRRACQNFLRGVPCASRARSRIWHPTLTWRRSPAGTQRSSSLSIIGGSFCRGQGAASGRKQPCAGRLPNCAPRHKTRQPCCRFIQKQRVFFLTSYTCALCTKIGRYGIISNNVLQKGKGRSTVSEFSVSLAKLAEEANLTTAYTPCELDKIQVTATEVYRPGILLAGYYENFDNKRIQIIGLTEMSYLDELSTSSAQHPPGKAVFLPAAGCCAHARDAAHVRNDAVCQAVRRAAPDVHRDDVCPDGPAHHDLEHRACAPHHPPRRIGRGLRRRHPDSGRQRRRQERDGHRAGQARPPSDRRRRG